MVAALETYAATGWSGFTMHEVATRSKVGKAALYRRWANKGELLTDAFMQMDSQTPTVDTGTLRGDIISTVVNILQKSTSPMGLVAIRAQVEAKVYPGIFSDALERWQRGRSRAGRAMVERAIERGEIPAGAKAAQVLDAVIGMATNHVLAMPEQMVVQLQETSEPYAASVADFVLRALTAEPQHAGVNAGDEAP